MAAMDLDKHNLYDGIYYCVKCGKGTHFTRIKRCDCKEFGFISHTDFKTNELIEAMS